MKEEELIKEYGMEFAIEKLAQEISEKIREYKKSKDKNTQKEIIILLQDREKVYNGDMETIKKYVKIMGKI